MQVGHIKERPIILVGKMWQGLIDWMKENPLKKELIDQKDISQIQIVEKMEDVVPILQKEIEAFYK
jgi:predicted Rossmann-fold nucleotide-binding protein